MSSSPSTSRPLPAETRRRILDAAARVFAREGLAGATTRGIAHEAGVNEVTLFRHFKSKDLLITAVVGENFDMPGTAAGGAAPKWSGDLRKDLKAHAGRYESVLEENMPLVRTMIGELHHRHLGCEQQVFKSVFQGLRRSLLERLTQARKVGDLPAKADLEVLTDLFNAMLFTGALRRSLGKTQLAYAPAHYQKSAVDLFLCGAAGAG